MNGESSNSTRRARIFISYKRNCEPDEPIALAIYEALHERHDVFIDRTMLVGTRWAQRIEQELRQADYLISFLSAHSVNSEMVEGEVGTAHRLGKEQRGRPVILPVRVAFTDPLTYPLSAYLNQIQWTSCDTSADTPRLIGELRRVIEGDDCLPDNARSLTVTPPPSSLAPLPSAQLEMPEGTMNAQSAFYVARPCDAIALNAIRQQGVTITIKGPRQVGKSSLLRRVKEAAISNGKSIVFVDFQQIDRAVLKNADLFFRQFCQLITYRLKIPDRVAEYWDIPLGNSFRTSLYFEQCVLPALNAPLVLAMDEVDTIFDSDFRSDFFSMLRSWHNSRADFDIWKQLDLALITSTEPYQFIADLNQSPFNVGEVLEPEDFSPKHIKELNRLHGSPFDERGEAELTRLLNGHPYLVRRALYLVANERLTAAELFASAANDRGPFGDHLRHHLFRMNDKSDLVKGLMQIIRNRTCDDERIFFRLRGAGLVRRDGAAEVPRCQLYADYFKEYLNV
ncbi:MAG: AAA-like domain-containing protein [Pyrinomonadaceae bacterium MAG19_C2-C3]|nr:AAA-like domain-containing protein [Pyrinomonadaceae bacterium MAG19_C2-C3]